MRILNYLIINVKDIEYVSIKDNYIKINLGENSSYKNWRVTNYKRLAPTINEYILSNLDRAFKWALKKFSLYRYSAVELIENGKIQYRGEFNERTYRYERIGPILPVKNTLKYKEAYIENSPVCYNYRWGGIWSNTGV